MSKLRTTVFFLAIAAAIIFQFSSCEQYVLPEVNLNPDTLRFQAAGGVLPAEIGTNVNWTMKVPSDVDWLVSNLASGKGTATVELTAAANTTGDERQCSVIISTETLRKNLVVIQSDN